MLVCFLLDCLFIFFSCFPEESLFPVKPEFKAQLLFSLDKMKSKILLNTNYNLQKPSEEKLKKCNSCFLVELQCHIINIIQSLLNPFFSA